MEEKFRLLTEQKKLYKINNTLMEVFVSCRLTDEISDFKEGIYVYVCVCAYAYIVKIHWFIAQKIALYPTEYSS